MNYLCSIDWTATATCAIAIITFFYLLETHKLRKEAEKQYELSKGQLEDAKKFFLLKQKPEIFIENVAVTNTDLVDKITNLKSFDAKNEDIRELKIRLYNGGMAIGIVENVFVKVISDMLPDVSEQELPLSSTSQFTRKYIAPSKGRFVYHALNPYLIVAGLMVNSFKIKIEITYKGINEDQYLYSYDGEWDSDVQKIRFRDEGIKEI